MSTLDWAVLFAALGGFVAYGVWRGRGERNLTEFLLAGRNMPWYMVALSVMATQASGHRRRRRDPRRKAQGAEVAQALHG